MERIKIKIMSKGTHGKDEKSFEELIYADQAKSLKCANSNH